MYRCEHHLYIPGVGTCCGYYSKTLDAYGRKFAHYPECAEENCPIKHPELLDGRKLEGDIEARCKRIGMIPGAERDNKQCFFCNAALSVKYIVEVSMPSKAPDPFKVHACNKCAAVKIR